MNVQRFTRGAAAAASLMAVAVFPALLRAQPGDGEAPGRIIQIGPDQPAQEDRHDQPPPRGEGKRNFWHAPFPGGRPFHGGQSMPAPRSPYFIGVSFQPVSDALRAHVDLPEKVGLLVVDVYPESPAAEAGLEIHDILVSGDGQNLQQMKDLVNLVDEHGGDTPTQITLEVIRHNQPQTVWVTPAQRPAPEEFGEIQQPGFREGFPGRGELEEMFRRPMQQFGFAPPLDQLPGGVSVTMERQNDGPAKITVRQGDQMWEIEGDDPESLQQLPESVRPMVEQMLHGPRFQMRPPVEMPRGFGAPQGLGDELPQRLQQMEEQMQQLQQRFQERAFGQPPEPTEHPQPPREPSHH